MWGSTWCFLLIWCSEDKHCPSFFQSIAGGLFTSQSKWLWHPLCSLFWLFTEIIARWRCKWSQEAVFVCSNLLFGVVVVFKVCSNNHAFDSLKPHLLILSQFWRPEIQIQAVWQGWFLCRLWESAGSLSQLLVLAHNPWYFLAPTTKLESLSLSFVFFSVSLYQISLTFLL